MTNSMEAGAEGISITRIFDAPREVVFEAWTTPSSFATWFGGQDADVPLDSCTMDARVGGSWKATMVLPDGATIDWDGEFIEVVFPERLVLTMRDRPGLESEPLTVEFREVDGKTEMKFHQFGGNMDADSYEQAGAGWMTFFDTMENTFLVPPEPLAEDIELQPAVAAQFCALAELLSNATDAMWNTESLCEGWRVLEIVAHMTMPARYSLDEFMAELESYGYDFTRLSNEVAVRDAGLPRSRLVADLRSAVLHHWTPPGGGFHGALNHVVIHSLDITVPLDLSRLAPDETTRVILEDLTQRGFHRNFNIDIEDRMLEASDLDWHYGSGVPLRATAEDLVLAMSGRRVPNERLGGAPLRRAKAGN